MPAPPKPPPPAPDDSVWHAPLVPAALAVTAGVILDRYAAVPAAASLLAAAAALAAWACARGGRSGLPLVYLALAGAAFGAAYHHYRRDVYPADDVGNLAPAEPAPAQVRGYLDEEPTHTPEQTGDPLRSVDRAESSATVLRVTHLRDGGDWRPASGRLRLVATGRLEGLHAGDEVEAVGRLARAQGPGNPGEFDYAARLRDQGIRAVLAARKTPDAVVRLARGWPASFAGWVAVVRGRGQRALADALPPESGGLAMALLLGEGSPLTADDWDKYVRTGVIHVLAISGQHLVVLAAVLWWALRRLGVRQRQGAAAVALVLLAYALLTGGRPPALRAAVAACAAGGALVLRRRTPPANAFALAWLVVTLLNPADLFGAGCQLSFLSVAVLYWGTRRRFAAEPDPLDRLVNRTRPAWLRLLRGLGAAAAGAYAVTLAIWLAVAPLAAARYHLVTPVGILLGPVLTALSFVALAAGFVVLGAAAFCPPLVPAPAWVLHHSLGLCTALVDSGDGWPGGHFYVPDVPEWWLWVFYAALLAVLTQPPLRRQWRWALAAGLGWLCVGLAGGAARLPDDELRVTFLAVGHGGCTVLETPDGRTLVYDAGALGGPEVTKRQVAPYLWWRGVRRVDELFLSHADLDHFNGVPDLLDRFAVGRVTVTPSFADKRAPGVAHALEALRRRGVEVRVAKAGDRLAAGPVALDVLHPPAETLGDNENARSLVLAVRHSGHTLLLTGDLEGAGLSRLLAQPPTPAEVLMAPHHGSARVDSVGLASWARPRVVVSCQGPPRSVNSPRAAYAARGAAFLRTDADGAVTVRVGPGGLVVETFKSGQRFVVRRE